MIKYYRYYEDEMEPIMKRFGNGREFVAREIPEMTHQRIKKYVNLGFVMKTTKTSNYQQQKYKIVPELVRK